MSNEHTQLKEFHWLIEVLQTVDLGLVVLDLDYRITAWNAFIENNSGIDSADALGELIFDVFPEIHVEWFKHKADTVVQLRNRAFTTWEQRPYIFEFKNNRPITGTTAFMYQNCTFIPVTSASGEVQNLAIIVYDVTDVATSKLQLKEANDQLRNLSRTDALTQLYNRGYWESVFTSEFLRQQRNPRALSMVIFDIDHFKKVNDTYGHQAGDAVIRMVADRMRVVARATDPMGRYGGEEFVVLLFDSESQDALGFAERLRKDIEQQVVEAEGHTLQVTVSMGIAGWSGKYASHKEWIEAADKALYESKHNGRNRSTVSPD